MATVDYSDIEEVKRLVKRIETVIQDDDDEFFAVVDKLGAIHISRDCYKHTKFHCISNTEFDSKGIDAIVANLHKYMNS